VLRNEFEQPVLQTRWSEQMQSRGFDHYCSNGARYRAIPLKAEECYRVKTGGK